MKRYLLLLANTLFLINIFSQQHVKKDFSKYFNNYEVEGCFVLFDGAKNEYIRYNSNLCDTGYLPASTFKIPNSLIALEEKVINDTTDIIEWNGHEWPHSVWNKDQTLKTALQYSCIWVYFGFAEQIGIEKYHEYLLQFDYGNKNLTGPPNHFWLEGPFKISANQQIEFLRKFYNQNLKISERSTNMVKSILVLEQNPNYVLSGKTGGAKISDTNYVMWLVGYLEKDNKPYYYALNFVSDDFNKTKDARVGITKAVLKELGLLE